MSATSSSAVATIHTTTDTTSTGFRPTASASPPVGSSRNSITIPCAAVATPICASDRPRDCRRSTKTVIDSPMGTNRSASSSEVAAPDAAQVGGAHGRRSGLGKAWRSTVTRSVPSAGSAAASR